MATWAARLPAVRDELHLSTGHLGFVLLAMSVGSVVMLPFSGALVRLLGPARTVVAASGLAMSGLALVGLATTVWLLAVGLFLTGCGIGAWDVAMNVEGAEVERRLARSVMPRFHAAFSLGTVAGAGVGAIAAAGHLSIHVQLPGTAAIVVTVAAVAARSFLAAKPEPELAQPGVRPDGRLLTAWLEPLTLLIGVLVFSMALAEGSANDWLALAVVDGYGATDAVGAVCFGVFVTGMTAMRTLGPRLLGRYDHVLVMRASAVAVLAGTGLVVAGAGIAHHHASGALYLFAALGALCWGCGAALGFPMGMTAAAADPARAATRVGVVSTIGYTAFLAGPPLLGNLGQHVGTAQSLVAVSVAVLLSLVTAGAVRQRGVAA
jgi:Na+/melibiose symporter-like transporter